MIQIEVLEMKNKISKIKITGWAQQKNRDDKRKESVNLKTNQQKLFILKNRQKEMKT